MNKIEVNKIEVKINKQYYQVFENEFKFLYNELYNNLNIRSDVSYCERITGLIKDLNKIFNFKYLYCLNIGYGGYIPIQLVNNFNYIHIYNELNYINHLNNININIKKQNINNIIFNYDLFSFENILYIENYSELLNLCYNENHFQNILLNQLPVIILNNSLPINKLFINLKDKYIFFKLTNSNIYLLIPLNLYRIFDKEFYYYYKIKKSHLNEIDIIDFNYDNLINLCIMVKNAGVQFENMLLKNIDLIDRWTILDTGSSDETIEIINKVLIGKKRGNLYQEPFINFRDSRNRLLELAGQNCSFTLMLDDTYIIKGDLRDFLNEVRGDQYSDSFSLYIKSNDVEYGSNRVLKTNRNLLYKYKIHEVITNENNINVIIPKNRAYIFDERFDFMEERTMNRKKLDLKLLYEEIEDDPNNPRTYYYLGQTYNLLGDYANAYKYFIKRMEHNNDGFIQEKIDAIFEASRIANFKLNKCWEYCEHLYLKCYELDKSRPDSLYFIGIHYYLENKLDIAYKYFKDAFFTGYPEDKQYSLKPTLTFFYLPKFLIPLCYNNKDFILGENVALSFLNNFNNYKDNLVETQLEQEKEYNIILSYYNIFKKLNSMSNVELLNNNEIINITKQIKQTKPLLIFVADGGFDYWTGRDIINKGVGGSETYIIEMATNIQKIGFYKVIVFCNTNIIDNFREVDYLPIIYYPPFVKLFNINSAIISRYSEYLPVAIEGKVENIYLVLHDLTPSGCIIPLSPKLIQIFCLSEWHVSYFTNLFPTTKHITSHFYYGIDNTKFENYNNINKIKNKFIYSSFANRGLLQLLQMWPKIYKKYNDASLHIYCDLNNSWVNKVASDTIKSIKNLFEIYNVKENGYNIYYYGWVDKEVLTQSWKSSEYWLYPNTFLETFCLTALEAALSKTIVITNGLAALENTVGNRGLIIKGNEIDVTSDEWKNKALEELFKLMEDNTRKNNYINENYNWAKNLSWENQAKKLFFDYLIV